MAYDDPDNQGFDAQEKRPLLDPQSPSLAPHDRRHAVFFIFGFLGLASLLPWNFFITAKKYFDYKFRNTSLPSNVSYSDKDHNTDLQVVFESYLSIVSNGSNLVFMAVTVLLVRSISVNTRIAVSCLSIFAIFIATSVLVKLDTDPWQESFFILTLVMAAIMSGCQSVLCGSVLGLSALFPAMYSQSAMIGQAAGGTFSSLVSIFTLGGGGGPISSAFVYFLIATAVTVVALGLYICLHFLSYSKFHLRGPIELLETNTANDINEEVIFVDKGTSKRAFLGAVLKKIWRYCFSVCLVFLVTLAVFPAVCSLITPEDTTTTWAKTYFTPVVCFLLFNVGDFAGRLFTFVVTFPGNHRPGILLLMTALRVVFIPLLMLCNAQPRNLPVVFENEAWPTTFIFLMGLTNGYLGTLCMSFGPVNVDEHELEAAGIILALAMVFGLAGGSFLSILLVKVL